MMNIAASFGAGRLTIYLHGELDHHAAGETIGGIEELIEESLPRVCVLDLSNLSFMDSSGIAVVIRTGRKMKTLGGELIVENAARQPQKILDAAGIGKLVTVAAAR